MSHHDRDADESIQILKDAEAKYELRIAPKEYVLARIDGRAFHTFTKNMKKPFEQWLLDAFCNVTKALCAEFNAVLGYTQSDEITLLLPFDVPFDRRVQKLASVLASAATSHFRKYTDTTVNFDCRVFGLTTKEEVVSCFSWRVTDCIKNSVSSIFVSVFGHEKSQGLNTVYKAQMIERSEKKLADYSQNFLFGTFFKKVTEEIKLTEEELAALPEKHSARLNPDFSFVRSSYVPMVIPEPNDLNEQFIWG